MTAALLDLAQTRRVSYTCMESLKQAIQGVAKDKLNFTCGNLYAVEHASLSQLISDACFPLYVCDLETDDLLYLNRKAEEMVGAALEDLPSRKCYQCIMHRDTPCDFCHKNEFAEDHFTRYNAPSSFDSLTYRVFGKKIQWNGHNAQVIYIMEEESAQQLKAIIEHFNGGVSVAVFTEDGNVRLAYGACPRLRGI